MKKVLAILSVVFVVASCNNGNNEGNGDLKDPNETHPVSETIPDSLKLVNDSTLVPDTTVGNGSVGTGQN